MWSRSSHGYDAYCPSVFNLMFADWANRGLNLWTVKQATQSLTSGTATYAFNTTYTDLLSCATAQQRGLPADRMSRRNTCICPTSRRRVVQYHYNRQTTPKSHFGLRRIVPATALCIIMCNASKIDALVNTTDAPFRFLPCRLLASHTTRNEESAGSAASKSGA